MNKANKKCKCESCGKTFSKSGHLKKHNHAIHGYSKYFKCETCGKSFSRAIYLTVVDSQCRLWWQMTIDNFLHT